MVLRANIPNSNTYDSSRVNEWIRNAIMHGGLEELDLDIRQPVELPPSIFTCKKLVILKLHMRRSTIGLSLLNMPVSVRCPCMKSIFVYCVRLCNDDSLKNLLNGCPVLEELYFKCECDDLVRTLFVKSSSLKRFTFNIEYCSTNNTELEMVVEAPNLQRLYICGMETQKIVVVDLSSVVAVTLNLRRSSVGADVYGNRFCQLLGKMSNTKYMEIHWRTLKLQSLGQARLENLPTFHNLVTLRVYDNIESSWHMLPFILKCSPNLINFHYSSNGNLQFHMPKCVMLHLEKFSLAASKKGCTDQEMRMVSYFLNNAPVLKEISIYSNLDEVSKMLKEISICSNSDEVSKMLKRFSTLPSRSTACRIIFKSWTTNSTINLYL